MTPFRRRILIAIGRGHASPQEIAREIGKPAAAVARATMAMSSENPQMLFISEGFGDEPEQRPWDGDGNSRVQLSRTGLNKLAALTKPLRLIKGGKN